jgi:hypothetical protein
MSYELGFKKAGLPLIRSYMHAVEAITPYDSYITQWIAYLSSEKKCHQLQTEALQRRESCKNRM